MCLDYSNLQERRNISKLYKINRGHWFPVYGLRNECAQRYFLQNIDVPTEISSGWNKVSAIQNRRRHLFCRRDNAFSRYTLAFAACRRELGRLSPLICYKSMDWFLYNRDLHHERVYSSKSWKSFWKKKHLFRSYGFAFISVIYFYDALINMPYHIWWN